MTGKIIKGSIILNREVTTQLGKVTAVPGTQLVSVFLGSVREGLDPTPTERLESLGWRQMTMFECAVRVTTPHADTATDTREWRLAFSCLGAVDSVEASIRFANKMVTDEFNRQGDEDATPFLTALTVGTIKLGPIGEDGTPYNGRGPAFFGWRYDRGISLEAQLDEMRVQAQRHSL